MNILFKILFVLFFSAIAVSLFTYSFFWYENSGIARRRALEKSGKSLPHLTLLGVLCGIASILLVILLFPLGFVRSLWRPRELSSSQPVIILVHGLYHNASGWLLLRHRLKKAGFSNVFAVNYTSFFTSFEAALEKLEKFIQRLRPAETTQPFIIIGHSLGGLLARAYVEKSNRERVPAAVITMGTPHRGSKMAAFAIGRLGKSLIYEGDLFEGLDLSAAPLPCTGISLVSPADNLVLPAEALEPPSGWVFFKTTPVSHVGMLFSRSIAGKIIELLKK
jgi:pimeloyl-ACP methyl ester carboxylesterase